MLKAIGTGNVQINLPNGNTSMPVILKECIHAPNLDFTLISVSKIARATKGVNFKAGYAVITHPKGHIMVKIPESQELCHLAPAKCIQHKYTNVAISKISLMEAHHKLGYIVCTAIKHMVSTGMITGIEIDPNSNEEFFKTCAKVKAACKLCPKELEMRAKKFGEQVHWDLWGPALVTSLGGTQHATC
jgi:hypothetical protein